MSTVQQNPPFPGDPVSRVYRLVVAFNGTRYFGWQRQYCENTVQQCVEDVLRGIFHEPDLVLTSCGRTDTGVHALGMTVSFHTASKIQGEELKTCLNKRLPHDVRIREAVESPGFNAHEEARGKAYVYAVRMGDYSLFLPDACWAWPSFHEPDRLKDAVAAVSGTHDFCNFTGRKAPVTVRTVYRSEMYVFGPFLCFYFSGNGFLHKMVRRIVGGLHEVAEGKVSTRDFIRAVEDPSFKPFDTVAPSCGLYLKRVFYSDDAWKDDTLEYPPFMD